MSSPLAPASPADLTPAKPRRRFPHALVLLLACIAVSALLTWVLPAGEYERREDPATHRMAVVPGTYHRVPPSHVGPWGTLLAVQGGIVAAVSVVSFIFLVGGAFSVVEETGALGRAVAWMVGRLQHRASLVIPAASAFFFVGGVTFGMGEEIVAFIPMLLLLVQRLGYDPLTAVAMSYGAAAIGVATGPLDPFAVGIAQTVAGVPLLSGAWFRMAVALPALALWVAWTMRYASRSRTVPTAGAVLDAERAAPATAADATSRPAPSGGRTGAILGLVALSFVALVWGVYRFDWGIDELASLFFGMGIVAGIIGGLGVRGTAESFVRGFGNLAFAALLVGFARGILVVLEQGKIIDTIVAGLSGPLAHFPVAVAAIAMLGVQALIHFAVPSTSGQAMITLPILAPLADLLGMSRQVAVLAYQYGAGLMENIVPTNGALMAMLALCGVTYDRWLAFAWRVTLVLFVGLALALVVAIGVGLK